MSPTSLSPVTDLDPTAERRSGSERHVSFAPPVAERRARPTLGLDTLTDIAVGIGRAEGLWRPHVSHDPLARTGVRLVATAAYEVWLLGWTPGQGVDFHDHGGANAAFVVVEGELTELTLGFAGVTTCRHDTGGVGTVPSGAIHDVVNRGTADATSIHVYSDPLRTMTYYDPDGAPRHTAIVQPVPALIGSEHIAAAAHPAGGGDAVATARGARS